MIFASNKCLYVHMYIYIYTVAICLCYDPWEDQTWAINNVTYFRVQVTDKSDWHLNDSYLSLLTQIYMLGGEDKWDESNPYCWNVHLQ